MIEYEPGRGKELNRRTGSTKYPEHFGLIRIGGLVCNDMCCWRWESCWLGSNEEEDGPIRSLVYNSDARSEGSSERVTDGGSTESELDAGSLLAAGMGSDILPSALLASLGVETISALLSDANSPSRPVFIF